MKKPVLVAIIQKMKTLFNERKAIKAIYVGNEILLVTKNTKKWLNLNAQNDLIK
jgi:hypothetical protein